MLGRREKLALQKSVDADLDILNAGISNRRERLVVQKRIDENLAQLNGEALPQTTLLDRFLAGEFTQVSGAKMMSIFAKVYEMANGQIEMLKASLEKFLEWHDSQGNNKLKNAILESALPCDFSNEQALKQLFDFLKSGQKGSITINRW